MNAETVQLINTVAQIVTPAGLIAWTMWFVTRHFWPWWTGKRADYEHEIQQKQVNASEAIGVGLQAQAQALAALAVVLEKLEPCLQGVKDARTNQIDA